MTARDTQKDNQPFQMLVGGMKANKIWGGVVGAEMKEKEDGCVDLCNTSLEHE